MLAMNLRSRRGVRFPALSLTTIASMLAPTDEPEVAAGCRVSRVIVGGRGPSVSWCQLLSL
ncbi:hypothetical protein PG5_17550 [Pseudomonas sp. G5(2012)]|jgi:hypothetical protein|nr:hypothetical protein PG5_17550 [Pseudomonas sp. G5(2012)]